MLKRWLEAAAHRLLAWRDPRLARWFAALWLLCLIPYTLVFLQSTLWLRWQTKPVVTAHAVPVPVHGPHAFTIDLRTSWMNQTETFPSPAQLLENGRPLAYPNSPHAEIGVEGRGRFSLWQRHLLFSTSDNSDPRTNGRKYELFMPFRIKPGWRGAASTLAVLATLLLGVYAWSRARQPAVGSVIMPGTASAGIARNPLVARLTVPGLWASLGILLATLAVLAVGLGAVLPVVAAHVSARQRVFCRVLELKDMKPKPEGRFFSLDISSFGLRSIADSVRHPRRSPLALLENGQPLKPHAELDELTQGKGGVFRHWWHEPTTMAANLDPRNNQDRLLFCPARGDPATNAYSVVVPATSADAFALGQLGVFRRIRRSLWVVAVLASILGAMLIQRHLGPASPWWYRLPLILALVAYLLLTTAVQIMDAQSGRPAAAFSTWDVFFVAPDSASYYFGYSLDSTRQPGYSWFIHLVSGGLDPNAVAGRTPVGAWIEDPSHPLAQVSRAQIAVLLGSGVVLCSLLMVFLRSPLPALFLVFFHESHFFIWLELNCILTEALTQAWLLLMVSCFLAFLWKEKGYLLLIAAGLVGASYLTRQASGYCGLFLAAMILWAVVHDWRRYWKAAVGSVILFLGLAGAPDLYAWHRIGKLAQESLTYQYRIVYALRVAMPEDVELMPDTESRRWLAESLVRRDAKDKEYDAQWGDDTYTRYVYRIVSTYQVSLTEKTEVHEIAFYHKIAGAIFRRRWSDYLRFGRDFWLVTIVAPAVDRVGFGRELGLTSRCTWCAYVIGFALAALLRGKAGYAGAVLILAHWAHVMICCLFAAPLVRMVWASDGLVIIAFFIVGLEAVRSALGRVRQWAAGAAV